MDKISEIKALLRERQFEKGVLELMDLSNKIIININNSGNNVDVLNEFKEILYHLEYAIKIQDTIKIIDILQYVMIPFAQGNCISWEV